MDIFDYLTIYNDRDFYDVSLMTNKYQGQYMDAFYIYKSNCKNIVLKDIDRNTIIYDKQKVKDINFEVLLREQNGDIVKEIKSSLELDGNIITSKEICGKYLSRDENCIIIKSHRYITENILSRNNIKKLANICNVSVEESGFGELIEYVVEKNNNSVLLKALIVNYYVSFVTKKQSFGRIIQLWFLIENGYTINQSFNLSKIILDNKMEYDALSKEILENSKILSYIDITPYLNLLIEKINEQKYESKSVLLNGEITKKEEALYIFAKEYFKTNSFSSKDLEKAYKNSSYETIRKFLIKFSSLDYLRKIDYCSRPRYVII